MTALPILADAGPAADFSNDYGWISLIKAAIILVVLLLFVLFALWFERRLIGRFQQRLGPNVRGPLGLVQSIPDALKLLLKEDITVKAADKVIYVIAPCISVVCAFLIFGVIPFGPEVTIGSITTPLQLTDMPVAVLYILGVTALGVYGIVLGGWSSGSTYPLLGAVRSTAQIISYELGMSLALVSVFIASGSMSTSEIVDAQTDLWWSIAVLPAFIIYVISMLGETNRLPFDLPEAEGELVAGYQTEYSSMKFAWYYLAEYINMLNVSAVATTLFLGGWHAPFPFNYIDAINPAVSSGWWGILWFMLKLWLLMGFFVWVRATLLRFRYDQFMNLGWKVLIPVALAWVVIVSVYQGFRQFGSLDLDAAAGPLPLRTWIMIAAGVLLIAAIAMLARPEPEQGSEPAGSTSGARGALTAADHSDEPFDAFAGGYPVPPLPGQQLPPSTRRARVTAPAGEDSQDKESDNA